MYPFQYLIGTIEDVLSKCLIQSYFILLNKNLFFSLYLYISDISSMVQYLFLVLKTMKSHV